MYQMKNNDEEEFALISGSLSSNQLASLFEDDSSRISDLKYLAPKQPQKQAAFKIQKDVSEVKSNTLILYASCVSMFCHENGSTINLGRVMCCITKDINNVFILLIYKTKQEVLSQALIHKNFKILIQPNNFAAFLDDKNIQRSIYIGNSFKDFLIQIGICRAFLAFQEAPDLSFFVQDISLGEGEYVHEGDTLKVSVCSLLIENFKWGNQTENQHDGVELTLKKLSTTWEMGLVGSQKNLRRIIFVPNVQANATDESSMIAYDVSIENIYREETGQNTESDLPNRTSIEPSLPPIPPSKVALINRMSKVGQALLPPVCRNSQSDIATDSESEIKEKSVSSLSLPISSSVAESNMTESFITNTNFRKNFTKEIAEGIGLPNYVGHSTISEKSLRPHSNQELQNHYLSSQEKIHYPLGLHRNSMSSCNSETKMSYHSLPFLPEHQTQQPFLSSSTESVLSLLLSESRSQNTDLRISLSKLVEKVDQVHAKLDSTEYFNSLKTTQLPYTPSRLFPQELLQQITSLVQENEELKLEVEMHCKKNNELNSLYTEILKKNQRLLEEKTELLLSHKDTNHQEKTGISLQDVLSIQEEKIHVVSKLNDANNIIENLEKEVEILRKAQSDTLMNEESYMNKLQDQKLTVEQLNEKLNLQSEELFTCKETITRFQKSIAELSSDNSKQVFYINSLKEENLELSNKLKKMENELISLSHKNDEINTILEKNDAANSPTRNLENSAENNYSVIEQNVDLKAEEKVAVMVKQIMNETYKKFKRFFVSSEVYERHQILENLLEVIKSTTLLYITKNEDSTSTIQNFNNSAENNENATSENFNHSSVVQTDSRENTLDTPDLDAKNYHKNIPLSLNDTVSANATEFLKPHIEQELISQGSSASQDDCISHTFSNNEDSLCHEKFLGQSVSDETIRLETDKLTITNFLTEDSVKDLYTTSPDVDPNSLTSQDYGSDSYSAINEGISSKNDVVAVQSSKTAECVEEILDEDCLHVPPPVPAFFSSSEEEDSCF